LYAVVVFGAVILTPIFVLGDGTPPKGSARPSLPHVDRRVPWTTSKFAGTPEPPPPYIVEPAFPKLKFEQPVLFSCAPGTDRVFVGEVKGKLYSFPNDPDCGRIDLAFDLARVHADFTMFYGFAFHPRFQKNGYVYLCYVLKDADPHGTRVSRFTMEKTDPPRIDPASEKVLITWLSGGHNGGCLAFGKDGYLYISTGDAAVPSPPDPLDTGQDVSDLLSSILRIDVDREDPGKAYRVPSDNPFVATPGARPEIWSFGFRNPWRMSFDRKTGDLWVGDVGWELWELIFRVERGGNYGWSVVEGRQPVRTESRRGPGPILPPTVDHPHSEASSITGGYVYRGRRFPDLLGTYIYGDFQTGKVWGIRHDGTKVTSQQELATTPLQLVSFGEDNVGELYLLDYERSKQIYRFVPNPAGKKGVGDFPRLLSRTGLFASTREHTPAPGVLPYRINAELWSDYAIAERLLALPGESRIGIDDAGRWTFPDGSVLARTVSLELEAGNPESRRRVETQVLHREEGAWRPYTYVWNEDQSDASLGDAQGSSQLFPIRDPRAPGGHRTHDYRFGGRLECLLCHNPWVETQTTIFGRPTASALAANAAQLNLDRNFGERVENQLDVFERLALFNRPLNTGKGGVPRLSNPYDENAELGSRARAYLQVNCAHCHQFGGGGATTIVLGENIKLEDTKTVDVRPMQGAFGIAGARIIAPGVPEGSVLYYRMAKLGGGRMPRAGSHVVDERAIKLMHAWIAGMPRTDGAAETGSPENKAALGTLRDRRVSASAREDAIRRLTSSTRGALALMGAIDQGSLTEAVRREIFTQTRDHPQVEVRDLFERFVPESERIKRLGDTINPDAILALRGDAQRGRKLFFAESATQCKNCHRVNEQGETLGPDLTHIGSKYTKAVLLQHILEPSRTIEPNYQAYLLETKSGQVHSGLLVQKTNREVVLKDAASKTIRIPASEVEQLVPQSKSIMPELMFRDLTAQQAADLLEFLAREK
jgi:uncharacterized repeat protein (TIGR03806 family)